MAIKESAEIHMFLLPTADVRGVQEHINNTELFSSVVKTPGCATYLIMGRDHAQVDHFTRVIPKKGYKLYEVGAAVVTGMVTAFALLST